MYRRYSPRPCTPTPKQCKPPVGEAIKSAHNSPAPHRNCNEHTPPPANKVRFDKSSLLGFVPSSLYNPETKKVLGRFSAEDLLLTAMILVLLDSDCSDDTLLVIALVYILLSDYIDLPF